MRILSLIFLAPFIALAQAKPQHPDGLELAEFATYPQMGNPVAIDVAADGRVFVAEQYRFNRGTEENRTSGFLLEDDLQIQTLDDRQAMYEKWAERYEGGMAWYSRYTDQIRLLTDSDRDGRADRSQIFASFNEPLDGLAAGVLAHGDDVWVTCVPHLWRFRDADRDGSPESSERVHTGFGVRASYLGHDLHGLVIGPDNRLYFSVGDRGFHVELQDGTVLHGPDEGGIFRCQMDGSNLELIHRGLRNPQEIVFDEWGNLFADDNNCDKGDKSRLVQVIDGGNSGWRMHYQTLVGKYPAGPWLAEDIWKRDSERAPLWHTRPADYLGAGPSGMTFSAVGAWPEALRNRFFYCNYTGSGGIETFRVEPAGAGFRLVELADFLKPVNISDCAFGYDGRLYAADYVGNPWRHDISGRVLTLADARLDPEASALRALAAADFAEFGALRLIGLLKHPDQRIRLRAQDTLARQGASAELSRLASTPEAPLIQRVHAIWGMWQLGLAGKGTAQLFALMKDDDPEIRAQAIRVLGDLRKPASFLDYLDDPSARVRYFAVRAIGRCKSGILAPKLIELAEKNDDHIIQQAIVIALSRVASERSILEQAEHHSAQRRLIALLTLRQWKHPEVARFLADADDSIALEAARAAHDLAIADSAIRLATSAERAEGMTGGQRLPMYRRVIVANRSLGNADSAERLLAIALHGPDETIQGLALDALESWSEEVKRDVVTGEWRPLAPAAAVDTPSVQRLATQLFAPGRSNDRGLAVCRALGVTPPVVAGEKAVAEPASEIERGRALFRDHPVAQCLRCHRIDGQGGEAGPDLSNIGKTLNAAELLESLMEPNARIAPGFEVASTVQVSAMPPMGTILTPEERHDLVAYLESLRK